MLSLGGEIESKPEDVGGRRDFSVQAVVAESSLRNIKTGEVQAKVSKYLYCSVYAHRPGRLYMFGQF